MEIALRRVHITNALFDTTDLFKLTPCGVTRRGKGKRMKAKCDHEFITVRRVVLGNKKVLFKRCVKCGLKRKEKKYAER